MNILIYYSNTGKAKAICRQFARLQGQTQLNIFWKDNDVYNRYCEDTYDFESCDLQEIPELDLFVRHGSDTIESNHPAFSAKRKWVTGEGEYEIREGESLISLDVLMDSKKLGELLNKELVTYAELEGKIREYYNRLKLDVNADFPVLILTNPIEKIPSSKPETMPSLRIIINKVKDQDTYEDLLKSILERLGSRRDIKALLIPAEIGLMAKDQSQYQFMHGTKLVRDLRRQKVSQVIWLYSYFSEQELRERDRYKVLDVPGQKYLQLKSPLILENIPALSQYTLDDINCFHFTNDGILREIFHSIGSKIQQHKSAVKNTLEEGIKRIRYFFPDQYNQNSLALNKWKELLSAKLLPIEDNYERRLTFENSKNQLWTLLDLTEDLETSDDTTKGVDFEILLIEDDESHGKKIVEAFEHGVPFKGSKVKLKQNGVEAIQYFKNQFEKKPEQEGDKQHLPIKVLISDWRLLEKDGKTWQWLQGLDVIENIAKLDYKIAFFMLTDKTGGILEQIKKQQRLPLRWYSKREVFKDEASLYSFCMHVIQEGSVQVSSESHNGPKGKVWTSAWIGNIHYPLQDYYLTWNRNTYIPEPLRKWNQKILFDRAEDILKDIKAKKMPDQGFGFQSKLTKKHVPIIMANDYINYQDEWDIFFRKLIGRLVYFKLRKEYDEMASSEKRNYPPKDYFFEKLNVHIDTLRSHLAIVEKGHRWQDNLLPEEAEWVFKNEKNDHLAVSIEEFWSEIGIAINYIMKVKHMAALPKYDECKKNIESKEKIEKLAYFLEVYQGNKAIFNHTLVLPHIKRMKKEIEKIQNQGLDREEVEKINSVVQGFA